MPCSYLAYHTIAKLKYIRDHLILLTKNLWFYIRLDSLTQKGVKSRRFSFPFLQYQDIMKFPLGVTIKKNSKQ